MFLKSRPASLAITAPQLLLCNEQWVLQP